jgi:hypothetical protein
MGVAVEALPAPAVHRPAVFAITHTERCVILGYKPEAALCPTDLRAGAALLDMHLVEPLAV